MFNCLKARRKNHLIIVKLKHGYINLKRTIHYDLKLKLSWTNGEFYIPDAITGGSENKVNVEIAFNNNNIYNGS